jgi:hypothetical protein
LGLFLAAAKIYVPGFIRQRGLELLFDATADAFEVAAPSTGGLSFDDRLTLYAQFTRDLAQKSIGQGNGVEIQSRLLKNAYRLGNKFKTDFHIHTMQEVMEMSAVIYKLLKIDFHGEPGGDIVIKRCFFSGYYSRDVCRLISSLDEGLITGLSGGGRLSFSQRITGGDGCCRAYLETAGSAK